MSEPFLNLSPDNLEKEHICCAISDKKHQCGVEAKKQWLKERLAEGHTFRKLDARGKVFIEYAPLETAWVPVEGENYLYIYCLWVAGSFKGKGYGRELLEYCLKDAGQQGKFGVCILSSKKKKPYLADKKFLLKYGFEQSDTAGDYELLTASFESGHIGKQPRFTDKAKEMKIESRELTIFYSTQCPFTLNCISQVKAYCSAEEIPLNLIPVDNLEKAKKVPCVFNNWAVFYNGSFETTQLLNENQLKKMLDRLEK